MAGFEYDTHKSEANLLKHGIDFESAQRLWDDPDLIEVQAAFDGEPRYVLIGQMSGKHWSAVITYRGDQIRLISVRRSREKEVELYERERL